MASLVGKTVVGTSLGWVESSLIGNWVRAAGGSRLRRGNRNLPRDQDGDPREEYGGLDHAADAIEQPRVDWRSGCYDEERYPPNITQRWCSSAGEFVLVNPTPILCRQLLKWTFTLTSGSVPRSNSEGSFRKRLRRTSMGVRLPCNFSFPQGKHLSISARTFLATSPMMEEYYTFE
jgi:hypothetical protein